MGSDASPFATVRHCNRGPGPVALGNNHFGEAAKWARMSVSALRGRS